MPKYLDLLRTREEEIRRLVELLGKKTKSFDDPRLVMTGGYALRAFVPFSRSTRDCDFVLARGAPWHVDAIQHWLGKEISTETLEKREDYAFLRCMKVLRAGKQDARISLDFMEGKVVGRTPAQVIPIDAEFMNAAVKTAISIGTAHVEVYVPSYADYLLLKIVSARRSDVRDIAALVWKNGVPAGLEGRATKLLPQPEIFQRNLMHVIVPDLEDRRFLHSWRGMFVATDFTEETKQDVLQMLRGLVR